MPLALPIEILRRIGSNARAMRVAILGQVRSKHVPVQPVITQDPVSDICTSPQSISADLLALGLPLTYAQKISSAYQRSALKLKALVEESYVAALQTQLQPVLGGHSRTKSLLITALTTHYTTTLDRWRSAIVEQVRRIREARDVRLPQPKPNKRPFNTSSVPILERFFEHNSRPSRAEKQQLAAQTMMNYKQINVWFQNRRNRSKKGAPVAAPANTSNKNNPLPIDLAAALTRILDQYLVPEEPSISPEGQCDSVDCVSSFGPFETGRPQHAFPVCYPPLCAYNPFPISRDTRCLSTSWYRTPVQSPTLPRIADASELLHLLDKLSLRETIQLGSSDRPAHALPIMGFAIRPPPAPLPALLRGTRCPPRQEKFFPWCAQPMDVILPHHFTSDVKAVQAMTDVRARSSRTSHGRVMSVCAPTGNASRRRRAYAKPCIDLSSTRADTLTSSGKKAVSATPDPALLSRPYPKGKPSRGKASLQARLVPKTSRQSCTNHRTASTTTSGMVSRQSREADSPLRSSPPRSLPALSRESSVSSTRSVSSLSSASSDSDLLLTPPLLPTSVLDYPVPDSLTFDLSDYAHDVPIKDAAAENAAFGAYMGYSLACVGGDPTLGLTSALFSQIDSIVPIFPEIPVPTTINPSLRLL